jgi:hypothetical protein
MSLSSRTSSRLRRCLDEHCSCSIALLLLLLEQPLLKRPASVLHAKPRAAATFSARASAIWFSSACHSSSSFVWSAAYQVTEELVWELFIQAGPVGRLGLLAGALHSRSC